MGKSSEDKALNDVNDAVGFVENLVDQFKQARVDSVDLQQTYLERMAFYKEQIKRLANVVEFVDKVTK